MSIEDDWQSACAMNASKRDRIAVECGFHASRAAASALIRYEQEPCADHFRHLCSTWQLQLKQRMSGCVGSYTWKRLSDLLVCSGLVHRSHVCTWPADCPGYRLALARLFRGITSQHYEDALFYLWRRWPNAQGLCRPPSAPGGLAFLGALQPSTATEGGSPSLGLPNLLLHIKNNCKI